MPRNLVQLLQELESWAVGNQKDANEGRLAFWALKVPSILAAAGAGIIAQYDHPGVSLVVGFIASVCVLIDGLNPRGALRNTHTRAYHDLRNLSARIVNLWRTRDPAVEASEAGRQIIKEAEEERQRIAVYLRDAEAALGEK